MTIAKGFVVALAVTLCLGTMAAPAEAGGNRGAVKYDGGWGKFLTLYTNKAGKPTWFRIRFVPGCTSGTLKGEQRFTPPFRKANKHGFRDGGTYKVDGEHGVTGKVRTHVSGKRVSPNRFRGTFRFKGQYFKGGEKVSTCRWRGTWSVNRVNPVPRIG